MKFLVVILVCALISVYEVSCSVRGSGPKRKRKLEVYDEFDGMQKRVKKKQRLNRTAICSGLDTSDRSLCSANYVNSECPPGSTCTIQCTSDALAVGPAAQKIGNSILLKCNGKTGTFKLDDNTCDPIERCGICLVPQNLREMKQADPVAYKELRKEEKKSTGVFPWEEYELIAPYECTHSMHFFHRGCIKDWLNDTDEKCPECRAVQSPGPFPVNGGYQADVNEVVQ
eukprot:971961_1